MQPTIELAKSSNTLNKLTFVLLYATDFADRLEKEIIPALKAGFVVLSDRYIFTALARAGVRGVDRQWLRNLYGFAIAPHLVFYLKVDVETLIGRVLEARGMDFWESGMDLKHGDDIYDSFRAYQNKLLREYALDGRRVPFPEPRRPPLGRPHPGRAAEAGRGVPRAGRKTGSGGSIAPTRQVSILKSEVSLPPVWPDLRLETFSGQQGRRVLPCPFTEAER